MKIGIVASNDIEETTNRCKQLGVQCVYIQCASLPGYKENGYPDLESLGVFKDRLEAQELEVPSASYIFGRWPRQVDSWRSGRSTNPKILLKRDRQCIDAMHCMIETLGLVGVKSVLHYVDIGKPEDKGQTDDCLGALIDVYRELISTAENSDVALATHSLHRLLPDTHRDKAIGKGVRLEDYGSYTVEGWGGPFLIDTWKNLRLLINAVPSPYNGITLCTGMDIVGGNLTELIQEFSDKIHFCQLRDHNDRWPAGSEVPLGEGIVDLAAVISKLKGVNYQGILNPEHLGKSKFDGEDLVVQAVAYIKPLL